MMPSVEGMADAAFLATTIAGLLRCLATRGKEGITEDGDFVRCNDLVQNALGDADFCRRIEILTGRDLRAQITPDELMALATEAELRRWGYRRN